MADVEQKNDSIHQVWNFPLLTCLQVGFCCQCIWFRSWVQIDSFKKPIKSNSVGSGNMSHCSASSLLVVLITTSSSSKKYNKASLRENHVWRNKFNNSKINVSVNCSAFDVCERVGVVKSSYSLRRSAQARYGPQGSGRIAGGSARDKKMNGKMREKNGGLNVEEKRSSHAWMRWHAQHPWAMRCNVNHDDTNLTNKQENCALTCQCSCALCWMCSGSWWSRCHWCRARCHHADVIPSTDFFPSGFCSSLLYL